MSLPDYTEIAKAVGVERCRGIDERSGHTCRGFEHHAGSLGPDNTIHWADRRPSRAGIRRFLWLVALNEVPIPIGNEKAMATWAMYYMVMRRVPVLARKIRVRLPADYGEAERALMRAMLVNLPTDTPGRAEALRWAQR